MEAAEEKPEASKEAALAEERPVKRRAVAKAKKAAEPLQAVEHPSHQKVQMPMWKFYLMQMQPLYLWAMLWQTLVVAGTCLMMSDSLSTAGDVIGRCQRLLLVRGCD